MANRRDAAGMKESQRTEWKESWHDEHLRVVCGFANKDYATGAPVQVSV